MRKWNYPGKACLAPTRIMKFDSEIHHRRSIRMAGFNYRTAGGYFVTICSAQKRNVFGKVRCGVMELNPYGQMLDDCWRALPEHFSYVVLDEYAIMPNHFHGILMFDTNVGARHASPNMPDDNRHGELGTVVGSFKSALTKKINLYRVARNLPKATVWQRNYYECIIRDENELNEIRRYIIENPLNWATDENYRP